MAKNEVVATLKKVKSAKPKNPKTAPQHPKVAEMVNTAISTLKDRRGSSLQAIKKYIASQYKVDVQKISPLINKYLKNSVESGTLIQTKGKGASGSFKMASQTSEKEKPKSAAPKAKKAAKPKSPTKNPKESKAMKPKAKKAAKPKTPKKASPTKNSKESKAMKPKAKKAAKPKTPKKASPTKNPKESKTMKPKAKKISGIMSCRGSMFAPRRSEIMKVE